MKDKIMPLSCSCDEWYGEGVAYYPPKDFSFLSTKIKKRCQSCKKLIDPGTVCVRFEMFCSPRTEVEAKIYGEDAEIPLAPQYLCEWCGEMYFNFSELGFCVSPWDDMKELLENYKKDYLGAKDANI